MSSRIEFGFHIYKRREDNSLELSQVFLINEAIIIKTSVLSVTVCNDSRSIGFKLYYCITSNERKSLEENTCLGQC